MSTGRRNVEGPLAFLILLGTGRISAKVTPQKFALQLYSRLTNANPELVLVFMQAGGSKKEVHTPSARVSPDTFAGLEA